MSKKRIRSGLQRTYINLRAWAEQYNIYHKLVGFDEGIYGFVYLSGKGTYYVIIDKNLTIEMQKEVFCHEVKHIMYDLPQKSYIVGLDMQHTTIENETHNVTETLEECII